MSATLELAKALIALPSVTPHDAGCQTLIADYLQKLGFHIEKLRFGEVENLWAKRGDSMPLFVFAGHTDVVPPGPDTAWTSPPFQPEIRHDYLYGRGAADMKSSIAAMLVACERFITRYPAHHGSIAFLITSDEEGKATDGTAKVIDTLLSRNEKLSWCIVGEASSETTLGDVIKNGRRGSLSGHLFISGIQGHIAYPQLADNPIHKAMPALAELCQTHWDNGNMFFQPTSFQISNIHAGTGAGNIIPGTLEIQFNFRYSPAVSAEHLQTEVQNILNKYSLDYQIDWIHSAKPFLTANGELIEACTTAIHNITGLKTTISTTGGTSDGRFIAPTGCQVIELGPCNATIHKIDECIRVDDLETLTEIYYEILMHLLHQ